MSIRECFTDNILIKRKKDFGVISKVFFILNIIIKNEFEQMFLDYFLVIILCLFSLLQLQLLHFPYF